jgi:heme-degrading monooxygenase HmoA
LIEILWEFIVRKDQQSEFERHYNSTGSWAQLFHKSPAFRSTALLRGPGGRYVTRDIWENIEAFRDFRRRLALEYDELDRVCERYTESERELGVFEVM